ncbi:MAG TPA: DNA ligase, partial [Actinomycetota bacterium]|nr:DNA ligase [Actinomycetota bacterium]
MLFTDLSAHLDRLEATSSRNELVRILADIYVAAAPEEISPITYLVQGRLAAFFVPLEIGL